MSSSNIFKHKLRELILNNYDQNKSKIISRNKNLDKAIKETFINTYIKNIRDNNNLPIKEINSFNCLNHIDSFTKSSKSIYNIKKMIRNNSQIKVFEEINTMKNFNNIKFNDVKLKTTEYINDIKKRSLKRNKTFQILNNEKGFLLNKPSILLNNEIFKIDKEYLIGISPVNHFINMKKKINEYKNEILGNKNNFFYENLIKDKNGKIKYKKFDIKIYNNKIKCNLNNNKEMSYRRAPSLIKFNPYKF